MEIPSGTGETMNVGAPLCLGEHLLSLSQGLCWAALHRGLGIPLLQRPFGDT